MSHGSLVSQMSIFRISEPLLIEEDTELLTISAPRDNDVWLRSHDFRTSERLDQPHYHREYSSWVLNMGHHHGKCSNCHNSANLSQRSVQLSTRVPFLLGFASPHITTLKERRLGASPGQFGRMSDPQT